MLSILWGCSITVGLLGGNIQAQSNINPTFFNPNKKLNQFILRNWSTEDGLPSSTLLEVVQGQDGYIWLSSFDGLIQFDGHSFQSLKTKTGKSLRSNSFATLPVQQNSELWIGTNYDGLLKIQGDTLVSVAKELEELQIQSFLVDAINDRIWIGTADKGLYFLKDEVLRKIQFNGVTYFSRS